MATQDLYGWMVSNALEVVGAWSRSRSALRERSAANTVARGHLGCVAFRIPIKQRLQTLLTEHVVPKSDVNARAGVVWETLGAARITTIFSMKDKKAPTPGTPGRW